MDKKKKIYNILLISCLIIFLEPQGFKEDFYKILMSIDNIYKALKLICFCLIAYIYGYKLIKKQIKISNFFIIAFLFEFTSFVATLVNKGALTRFCGPALTVIAMIMLAEIIISENKMQWILKNANIYFRICFFINLFTIILVDGFNVLPSQKIYFLGIDNRWIFTYLPWITFEFLLSVYDKNNKKKAITYFILSELTLLFKFSVSAMLASMLWIFIIFEKENIYYSKYAPVSFLTIIITNLLFVFVKIQKIFNGFLVKILHKDWTLSGRTYLWDKIIKDTSIRPFLGNGTQSIQYDKNYFSESYNNKLNFLAVVHGHNSFMTVLYRSGIIGLILYFTMWLAPLIMLFKSKNNNFANKLFISIIIALILSIFDTIDCSGLYFILLCAFNIEKLNSNINKE